MSAKERQKHPDPDLLLRIAKNHVDGGMLKLRTRGVKTELDTEMLAVFIAMKELIAYVEEKTGYEG